MQSVIQILSRAGSVSLSRAGHVSWNVEQQQQPGSDDQRYVRHFLRRRRLSRLVETRKLFNDPTSCVSLVRPSHDQSTKSHAETKFLRGSFSLSLSLSLSVSNDFNAGSRSTPRSVSRSWFPIGWILGNLTRSEFRNRRVSVAQGRFSNSIRR